MDDNCWFTNRENEITQGYEEHALIRYQEAVPLANGIQIGGLGIKLRLKNSKSFIKKTEANVKPRL